MADCAIIRNFLLFNIGLKIMKQILANDIDKDNLEEQYYIHQINSREKTINSILKQNRGFPQSSRLNPILMSFPHEEEESPQEKKIKICEVPSDLQRYSTMVRYNPKLEFRKNKIDEINSLLMEGMREGQKEATEIISKINNPVRPHTIQNNSLNSDRSLESFKLKKYQKELIGQNLILKSDPSILLSTSSSKYKPIFTYDNNVESDPHKKYWHQMISNKRPISYSSRSLLMKQPKATNSLRKYANPLVTNGFSKIIITTNVY